MLDACPDAEGRLIHKIAYASMNERDLPPALAEAREGIITEGIGLEDGEVITKNLEVAKLFGISVPDDSPTEVLQQLIGDRRLWQERLNKAIVVEQLYQLERFAAQFLEVELARGKKPRVWGACRANQQNADYLPQAKSPAVRRLIRSPHSGDQANERSAPPGRPGCTNADRH